MVTSGKLAPNREIVSEAAKKVGKLIGNVGLAPLGAQTPKATTTRRMVIIPLRI